MADGKPYRPILCVDFDGVIHSYMTKWVDAAIIPDPPVPGAFDFLQRASVLFDVMIYSSRSKTLAGIEAMRAWMKQHGGPLDCVEFCHEKPAAFLTLDDRAVCFTGTWPEPQELRAFKPWNK